MTMKTFLKRLAVPLLAACLPLAAAGWAGAESYSLKAGVTVIPAHTFNNAKPITMWGFAKCDASFANCSSVQVPGPILTATAGQALTITVRNDLAQPPGNGRYLEPVSLVVPGLVKQMSPVFMKPVDTPRGISFAGAATVSGNRPQPANPANMNDPAYGWRVRSFDAEAPADGATTVSYSWPAANVKEGTYLYQSGTHPSLQVQMGLYGALIVYPGAGQSFGASGSVYQYTAPAFQASPAGGSASRAAVHYDTEAVILFSEIDPVLHQSVTTGHYGPIPPLVNPQPDWMTSTANYTPRWFLVNGAPYSPTSPGIAAGNPGQTVLLRFLNAGLATKVPTLQDSFNMLQATAVPGTALSNLPYMTVLAEDGNPVPWLRQQYSLMLAAGKTMDAVITTAASLPNGAAGGNIALYDRRGNLTNAPMVAGGQLTFLHVGQVPMANVLPTSLDFGQVDLNAPQQRKVIVKNNGNQALLVSNAAPAGVNAAEFRTDTAAALGSIAPGQSAVITLYFTPKTAGAKSASLHLVTSDPTQATIDIPIAATGK